MDLACLPVDIATTHHGVDRIGKAAVQRTEAMVADRLADDLERVLRLQSPQGLAVVPGTGPVHTCSGAG